MAMSNKQKLIRGLVACGWVRDLTAKTSKYQVYAKADSNRKLLVGKSGALRTVPQGQPVSNSTSFTGSVGHRAYILVGQRADAYSSVEQATLDFVDTCKRIREQGHDPV